MSKADREAETRGYHVPDTRDIPKVWADGPHKGKRVGTTPVKVRSLKLDPDVQEIELNARRLHGMSDSGRLGIDAMWAEKVFLDKKNAYEMAVMLEQNAHLRQRYMPPSRRPIYLLVTVLALLVALQFALFFQSQRPTLPEPRTASEAPQGGEEVAEHKQGRAH